nr:thioesterase family protein [Parazoarcus communis]
MVNSGDRLKHDPETRMSEDNRKLLLETRIPVRWGDMDAYGHVNNTIYFRYFEQARVEWLESQGSRVSPEEPVGPVIINASCTFYAPVNYPATVIVKMYGGEPGRTSVMTWYELFVEGEDRLYADGAAKTVWMDTRTGKSSPLPDTIRLIFD